MRVGAGAPDAPRGADEVGRVAVVLGIMSVQMVRMLGSKQMPCSTRAWSNCVRVARNRDVSIAKIREPADVEVDTFVVCIVVNDAVRLNV